MATRKRPKKRHGRAKLKIRQKIKNGGKKVSIKPSSAVLLNKKEKMLADPLAISLPSGYLSYDTCQHILVMKKTQYKLWSWAILLAFILLFAITAIELMLDFKWINPSNKQYVQTLSDASLLAIFVIGIELASSFALAKNKMLFLRNNWLAILAIIPAGIIARAGSGIVEIVEAISSLRALQLAGKLGEIGTLVPNISIALPHFPSILSSAGEFAESAKTLILKIAK